MGKSGVPGEFEQLVMLAVLQLGDDANAPAIAAELEARAGRRVSRGALYATLDRLEGKRWVSWVIGAPTEARGGYRKRVFRLEPEGLSRLREARRAMAAMAAGLDSALADPGR